MNNPLFKNATGILLAKKIAESQKDLGGLGQTMMAISLSPGPIGGQTDAEEAYNKLDPLSQLIVRTILSAEDLESAENDFGYMITCLQQAREAIQK